MGSLPSSRTMISTSCPARPPWPLIVVAQALRPSGPAVAGSDLPDRLATTPILMGVPVAVDFVTGGWSSPQADTEASTRPVNAIPTPFRAIAWRNFSMVFSS